jgi:hypothetical protein
VEEGARAASEASEQTPGETLFAVSLLLRAPVTSGGKELGRCIDAMAGCSSGRLNYVIVSQGGVAGVGETLQRLPWEKAKAEGETIMTAITASQFEMLEELPRDQWPGR